MEKEIQLKDILRSLKKGWLYLIFIPLLFGAIGFLFSKYYITPIYSSKAELLVNTVQQDSKNSLDVDTNLRLIPTYEGIIKSSKVLETASENSENEYKESQLREGLKVITHSNSQIIGLVMESDSDKKAVEMVNLYAETVKEEIPKVMGIDNIKIMTEARVSKNAKPISPNILFNTAVAYLIGLVLVVLVRISLIYKNL